MFLEKLNFDNLIESLVKLFDFNRKVLVLPKIVLLFFGMFLLLLLNELIPFELPEVFLLKECVVLLNFIKESLLVLNVFIRVVGLSNSHKEKGFSFLDFNFNPLCLTCNDFEVCLYDRKLLEGFLIFFFKLYFKYEM